ncbi:MAG: A17 family peptidase, partial [Candidatus Thiodiazotropha endolucinida]|nr:A17 family peptidase [Candidatus Thiodiazotropha taylori]MCW4342335.1 A17 family peptidase [Candidatus Thiodiazotropha endolucinida]
MLHDLCGMLIRFRIHPIALVADIEKAFLQISLQNNQRNATRFFWLKDIENPTARDNIQEYRFCRIPFGVISSPFLLGATIEHHLDSYGTDIANKIKNDIYVDNLVTGVNSVPEAKALYSEAKTMFNEGSMNLREWVSNKDEVNAMFTSADKAEVESLKVLGHKWDIVDDTISFKTIPINSDIQDITKRIILKQIASIFDPMGLICPLILPVKVLIQSLWSKNLDWDECLSDQDQQKWFTITADLEKILHCRVPRCISRQNEADVKYKLLCFSDASEKAYAAVVYLNETSNQKSTTNLVFAKSRLAPLKKMSIPRLELLAVVIGLKCLKYVKEQTKLPIIQLYLWTDSQCVLHWINSNKTLSVFVRNRVKEIKEYTDVLISYVPSKENPADIASRGTTTTKLLNCELWWNGPTWLQQDHEDWPIFDHNLDDKTQEEYEFELSKTKRKETNLLQPLSALIETDVQQVVHKNPMDIDSNKFSSITKLLRVTVLAVRFVRKLQRRSNRIGYISSDEIQDAELLWIRQIQRNHFNYVFEAIHANKETNIQRQLNLYIDPYEILRCKGRLENSCLAESARYPILLPKKDRYTKLVIEKNHKEILHSGVSQTLARIRFR